MAVTVSAMAMTNAKCFNSPKLTNPTKLATTKSTSLLSFRNLPKGLTSETTSTTTSQSTALAGTAIAGAVFAALSSSDAAFAAQQIAEIADGGDNRGLALLLPIIPAIGWVLFNIFQPALNQLNRMRSSKGVIVGLGLGGLVGSGLLGWAPESSAAEVATIAAEAANDNRGTLLLFVVAPAILWVLYNILQPALNQLNRMRSE